MIITLKPIPIIQIACFACCTLSGQITNLNMTWPVLELANGVSYENATIRSYNAENGRVMVIHDMNIASVHISDIPEDLLQAIMDRMGVDEIVAPPESASVGQNSNVVKTTRPETNRRQARSVSPVRASAPIAQNQNASEQAFRAKSIDTLRSEVLQYYRYRHRIGSNDILVLRDSLKFDQLDFQRNPQFGVWHLSARGTIGIQYYDSTRRNYRRLLARFAANVEENTDGTISVRHFRHIDQN